MNISRLGNWKRTALVLIVGVNGATASATEATPAARLDALANRFVKEYVAHDPTVTYWTGVPTQDHSRFPDRSPKALADFDRLEAKDLAELNAIDVTGLSSASRVTYAVLKEQLESDLQARVCRAELWSVNHMSGWQNSFADVAEQQPVGSAVSRSQALQRWKSLPRYVDIEIANLRRGLAANYAAPKSLVKRVIAQMDTLSSGDVEKSPFYSPAARDPDPGFRNAFARLLRDSINPALRRYRNFLSEDYLPHARDGVAMSDLPNGSACYQALLRSYTTLNRTPQEVFDLGQRTVEANKAEVIRLGTALFGTTDFGRIIEMSKARVENHFQSKDELLQFSRSIVLRAKTRTATLIDRLPRQDAVVEPERDFEDAAGASSHYDPNPDVSQPGVFRIELGKWQTETRADAELTAVHEVWPGHHLQIALAREIAPQTSISKLSSNSAYIEGWARYAEALGEEAGIYETEETKILRRVWPARGMVVDPGLHAFHWTRQQAVDYLVATGRFDPKAADATVDRIAAMPGQLTAYDSGGLEIKALRAEAEQALGTLFDLREFNRVVLESGVVPLTELRFHVMAWIDARRARGQSRAPTLGASARDDVAGI